ncbi:TPA: GFA family protein [Raoultella planticola]
MESNEGGCLCKSIRYRVKGVPLSSIICHCVSCRKSSSAPSVAWLMFESENLDILQGSPQSFESSTGVTRSFCAECGSALFYSSKDAIGTLDVTTISLDDDHLFPPTREVWLDHRVSWESKNDSLAQYPRGTNDGPYKS